MTTYVLVDDSDTSFFTYSGATWTDFHEGGPMAQHRDRTMLKLTGDPQLPFYYNQTFWSSTTNASLRL
jgi:hypothetical protein